MKTKNFYIVRFFLNNEVKVAISINKTEAKKYKDFFDDVAHNEAGGTTTWFRVDLDPNQKWFFNQENTTEEILFV